MSSVAVLGAGVVGQLTIQFARLSGAFPIISVDLLASRLELARRNGATHLVDASARFGNTYPRSFLAWGALALFGVGALLWRSCPMAIRAGSA